MNATPRFRLFYNSRRGDTDLDERAAQTLSRRLVLTSVSVARTRRRNRRRPSSRRGLAALVPRWWFLPFSGATTGGRRRAILLLLVACAAGFLASSKLRAWATVFSLSPSSASSISSSPLSSRPLGPSSAGGNGVEDAKRPAGDQMPRRQTAVSLGPDAIPSVLLVERGPGGGGGGGRRASSLGWDAEATPGGDLDQQRLLRRRRRCRNTQQGAVLLADSEGRVCRRTELDDIHRPGCCAARPPPLSMLGDSAFTRKRSTATDGRGGVAEISSETGLADNLLVIAHSGGGGGLGGGDATGEGGGFPTEQALSTPFSCWSCDEGHSSCCRTYEFCVSCCQAPWREREREVIRAAAARSGHPAYRELGRSSIDRSGGGGGGGRLDQRNPPSHQLRGVVEGKSSSAAEVENGELHAQSARESAFAHCAFRCRTHSGSVAHENSYRSHLKHCFGRFLPPMATPGGNQGKPPPLQLDPYLAG